MSNRIFLGIIPPIEARREIRDLKRKFKKQARNLYFIPMDQAHINLQFIGSNISDELIEMISETCQSVTLVHKAFDLSLSSLAFGYPGQNIARSLHLDVENNSRLNQLVKDIHNSLKTIPDSDINKKKDHSKLINQLTLAKVKTDVSRSYSREMKDIISKVDFTPITFRLESLQLIKSERKGNITQYTPLKDFKLS